MHTSVTKLLQMRTNRNKHYMSSARCGLRTFFTSCFLAGAAAQPILAQQATKLLDPLVVQASGADQDEKPKGWLPEVEGAAIYSGKKTSVIANDEAPEIVAGNYRQALARTPGLLLSEESSPLLSLGYRGLDPHRSQFTQVLRDGIPIHADQFGYPEAYYTPALESIERIDFLHGGAALQYGPQPGGALNYISKRPRTDKPFHFQSQNVFGSDGLYSNYTAVDGTSGKLGYSAYANYREFDGFRDLNSSYQINSYGGKLVYALDGGANLILDVATYREEHDEPGGLTRADFSAGNKRATRRLDGFELDRDSVSLTYETDPTADSFFTATAWFTDYRRFSSRQGGGGFGTLAVGPTLSVETQEFETLGLDARFRHNWGAERQHTLSTGFQLYHVDSPRTDDTQTIATGIVAPVRDSDREVFYAPFFVENKFTFGPLSITPGVRMETFSQDVKTVFLSGPPTPTRQRNVDETVVLGGLGLEYEVAEKSAIYANVSQGYRPAIFTESVPTGGGAIVPNDLEEGKSIEYEIGYRAEPTDWLTVDTSVFLLEFKDQIGTIGAVTANVGDSRHKGIDVAAALDVFELAGRGSGFGGLDYYLAATFLDADFTGGPANGFEVPYAPEYIIRTGLSYTLDEKVKVNFGGTYVASHFADATNTAQRAVPSYKVWDLTAEYRVSENLRLIGGINNLFDEQYFARVRNDGIDPANGRNYYLGASIEF